ncbi:MULTISPECIES: hypothetical protein [unclassified Kribbella]|uniref:hypothetical protein n=1 Tax=unclassified Kribbella TaxID=2644121 RepID=UPI003077A4F2
MNEGEYADWIHELVGQGVYDVELGEDFIRQRALFEELFRPRIVANDPGLSEAVGCVADVPVEAHDAPDLVGYAGRQFAGRALYFESLRYREG